MKGLLKLLPSLLLLLPNVLCSTSKEQSTTTYTTTDTENLCVTHLALTCHDFGVKIRHDFNGVTGVDVLGACYFVVKYEGARVAFSARSFVRPTSSDIVNKKLIVVTRLGSVAIVLV